MGSRYVGHPSRFPASHPTDIVGFCPGTVVAERYRIVAMLGRGGMSEVYRADDLRLSQERTASSTRGGTA